MFLHAGSEFMVAHTVSSTAHYYGPYCREDRVHKYWGLDESAWPNERKINAGHLFMKPRTSSFHVSRHYSEVIFDWCINQKKRLPDSGWGTGSESYVNLASYDKVPAARHIQANLTTVWVTKRVLRTFQVGSFEESGMFSLEGFIYRPVPVSSLPLQQLS